MRDHAADRHGQVVRPGAVGAGAFGGTGENCANLEVEVVDGRAAPAQVAELAAHVWIPDDAAWAETAGSLELAEEEVAGSGTVVATSPIYMVTDEATAEKVAQAGSSWRGLADLVTSDSGSTWSSAIQPARETA